MKTPTSKNKKRKRYGTLEPLWNERRQSWIVDISAKHPGNTARKRIKLSFDTRDDARKHIDGLAGKDGTPCPAIPAPLAHDADKAREILEPWNRSLTDAARELAEALKVIGSAGTVMEAAKAFRLAHDRSKASKPLGEAVGLYLDARADLRKDTLTSYKYTLEKVLASLGETNLSDITVADVAAIFQGKGATAHRMHLRNLRAFWNWASMKPRAWCLADQLEGLEHPRQSDDDDVTYLKPDEVRALLKSAEALSHAAAATYAVILFGGVRRSEVGKLLWSDVGEDYVSIGSQTAKKIKRRLVPISPTLRAWLSAHRDNAPDEMKIAPPNWAERDKCVRRLAGWDVAARLLKNPPKPTRGKWDANSIRHTNASVEIAIGTPLEDLIFKFGHTKGHELLRRHYLALMTKKEALAILAIGPNGTKVPLVNAA